MLPQERRPDGNAVPGRCRCHSPAISLTSDLRLWQHSVASSSAAAPKRRHVRPFDPDAAKLAAELFRLTLECVRFQADTTRLENENPKIERAAGKFEREWDPLICSTAWMVAVHAIWKLGLIRGGSAMERPRGSARLRTRHDRPDARANYVRTRAQHATAAGHVNAAPEACEKKRGGRRQTRDIKKRPERRLRAFSR